MKAAAVSASRYRLLDHWRGFAALWVMVFHTCNVWLEARPDFLPPGLAGFVRHGWLGVHVFFVISGYCIAERLALEYRRGGTAARFIFDRLWRLLPPYWAALVLLLLCNAVATVFNHTLLWADAAGPGALPGTVAGWLKAVFILEPWFGEPSYLLVSWSLAFELGFYLLGALCLQVVLASGRAWTGFATGGILLALGLMPWVSDRWPLLALWPHFAVGCLVWLLCRQVTTVGYRLGLGVLLFGAVFGCGWLLPAAPRFQLQFASGCALLLLALRPFDGRLADMPVLRWLGFAGTFSYSIYLVHAPVVGKLRNLLGRWWRPGEPGAVWVPVAACALALALAWLFYRLIELSSEERRRAFARRTAPFHSPA